MEVITNNEIVESSNELDALLAEYNTGLKENLVENDTTKEINTTKESAGQVDNDTTATSNILSSHETVSETIWRGNNAYYQTGSKQGRLRPTTKKNADGSKVVDQMEISGTLIDGALFIMLIDMLFPLAITFLNNRISEGKIKVEDLQMSEKQKKDLQPICDEVVKQLTLKANPVWLLVIAMSGIYGINFMAAKSVANAKLNK